MASKAHQLYLLNRNTKTRGYFPGQRNFSTCLCWFRIARIRLVELRNSIIYSIRPKFANNVTITCIDFTWSVRLVHQ